MAKHKDFHLTVRNDFAGYRKGDHIEDEAAVEGILSSEHRHHVIRVAADKATVAPVKDAPAVKAAPPLDILAKARAS